MSLHLVKGRNRAVDAIDNPIFISILTNNLPEKDRARARNIGIGAALVMRLALLGTIAFIVGLTATVFTVFGKGLRDPEMSVNRP